MNDDKKVIGELLGSDFGKVLIEELGVENDSLSAQATLIDDLGQVVLERVTLEIFKVLPKEEWKTLDSFLGGENIMGLRAFLLPYIPNLDEFIHDHSQREFENFKTHMRMAEQGLE